MRKTKRTITLVAILVALMGMAGAEEVGAPGMGIDMGIDMPDFGSDEWISIQTPGTWTGGAVHAGWTGGYGGYSGYSGSGKAQSYGLKLNLTASGIVTITNLGSDRIDIGSLKLVKVLEERPLRTSETLAYLPYTLILAPGASTNVVLQGSLISGDKVILTNGLGIYTEMTAP